MTEAEWLASEDPAAMLAYIGQHPSAGRNRPLVVSDRKLRLFACACCRGVWHLLGEEARRAVVAAERWADLPPDRQRKTMPTLNHRRSVLTRAALYPSYFNTAAWMTTHEHIPILEFSGAIHAEGEGLSLAVQATLLRDIAGNPFRPVVLPHFWTYSCPVGCTFGSTPDPKSIPEYCRPSCGNKIERKPMLYRCPWLTPQVLSLAQAAYNDRLPDCTLDPLTLAATADALEEAGCNVGKVHYHDDGGTSFWWNDAFGKEWPHLTPDRAAIHPLLAHLRDSSAPHVRGCWALDLVLGKE